MTEKKQDSNNSSGRRKQDKIAVKGKHAGQEQVEAVIAVAARVHTGKRGNSSNTNDDGTNNPSASRETVESIAVAIILAFLFR